MVDGYLEVLVVDAPIWEHRPPTLIRFRRIQEEQRCVHC